MCYIRTPTLQDWYIVVPASQQKQLVQSLPANLLPPYGPPNGFPYGFPYGSPYGNEGTFNLPKVGCQLPVNLWSRLAKFDGRSPSLTRLERFLDSKVCTGGNSQQQAHLAQLPFEILQQIVQDMTESDILMLGATCHSLLRFVLGFIVHSSKSTSGFWAGKPLAVMGTWSNMMPGSFLQCGHTHESVEMEHLHGGKFEKVNQGLIQGNKVKTLLFRVQSGHIFCDDCAVANQPGRPIFEWVNNQTGAVGVLRWSRVLDGLPYHKEEVAFGLLNSALNPERCLSECSLKSNDEFRKSGYYLRNLTTRQLIRVCVCQGYEIAHVRPISETTQDLNKHQVSLDDIMMLQTRLGNFKQPYEIGLTRDETVRNIGRWTGHSFDVVSVNVHQSEYPSEPSPVQSVELEEQMQACKISTLLGTQSIDDGYDDDPKRCTWEDVTAPVLDRALRELYRARRQLDEAQAQWEEATGQRETRLREHRGFTRFGRTKPAKRPSRMSQDILNPQLDVSSRQIRIVTGSAAMKKNRAGIANAAGSLARMVKGIF